MSFIKYHLKLEQHNFKPSDFEPIVEEPYSYERFWELLQKVGSPSYWPDRAIFKEGLKGLKAKLSQGSSHLWVFKKGDNDVGFCQVANIEELTAHFKKVSGIAEIYKVGLFPNYIGRGMGKGYISAVARELFKDHHTIYLNTRDSNVVNSVPFYERLGFEVFKKEIVPDDHII